MNRSVRLITSVLHHMERLLTISSLGLRNRRVSTLAMINLGQLLSPMLKILPPTRCCRFRDQSRPAFLSSFLSLILLRLWIASSFRLGRGDGRSTNLHRPNDEVNRVYVVYDGVPKRASLLLELAFPLLKQVLSEVRFKDLSQEELKHLRSDLVIVGIVNLELNEPYRVLVYLLHLC